MYKSEVEQGDEIEVQIDGTAITLYWISCIGTSSHVSRTLTGFKVSWRIRHWMHSISSLVWLVEHLKVVLLDIFTKFPLSNTPINDRMNTGNNATQLQCHCWPLKPKQPTSWLVHVVCISLGSVIRDSLITVHY